MASEQKREFRTRDRWLNFALILAPAAWLLHLNISYALVPESCDQGSKFMLHAVTVACVLLTLVAAFIAWRVRAACDVEPSGVLWQERTKWLATVVLVLSLAMTVVILAQQIPNLILRSCD